jgi:glycosyltransferase involved in cell wall biosynthesis
MKTLLFCNLHPRKPGAFEQLLGAIGGELNRTGDEFVLGLAGDPAPAVTAVFRESGIRWHVMPGWHPIGGEVRRWAFVAPALRLLSRERPDVAAVHFGNELQSLVPILLWRLRSRAPRWVWQQDQRMEDPTPLKARLSGLRLLCLVCDRFVAVYEGGRRSMELRGIPPRRIAVIRNSVPDHESHRPRGRLRAELGLGPDAVLAVAVSSLIPRKRVDLLVRAIQPVAAVGADLHLAVAGDGPERDALRRLACQAGVAARVHFLGLRDDARDLLAESDIFVHASEIEACSYAIGESMAAGLPAVVVEAGAAREQVVDGGSGFVVKSGNETAIVERLSVLAADAGMRRRMGAAARSRWNAMYRTDVAAREYAELYRSAANRA